MTFRILIIDDEPNWIEFAQSDLNRFVIVVARSFAEAVAELEKNRFDLVIASARCLPILEVIKERFGDKRVVVTTMQPTTQEALKAYRLGALRYFPKSFGDTDLLDQVTDVLPPPASVSEKPRIKERVAP